jgi:hypothetical protein
MAAGEVPAVTFVEVELGREELRLAGQRGRYRHEEWLPVETQAAKNEGFGREMAGKYFGDAACSGGEGLYVNPTRLKQVRREFAEKFEAGRAEAHARLRKAILDQVAREAAFQPEDATLLTRGPAAVSRVTGFVRQRVRTSGGDWLEIEPKGKGTVVWGKGKKGGGAEAS